MKYIHKILLYDKQFHFCIYKKPALSVWTKETVRRWQQVAIYFRLLHFVLPLMGRE